MNFNINPQYQTAVQNFAWSQPQESESSEMYADRLKNTVQEISKQIMAASQIRPMLVSMKPGLSLGDVCYLVAQDLDKKSGNPTVSQIENASVEEKKLLNHTFRLLSKDFIQVNESDLKVATLLFGAKRIHELAISTQVAPPAKPVIQEMQETLTALQTLRNQYAETADIQSETIKNCLTRVDAALVAARVHLQQLQQTPAAAPMLQAFNASIKEAKEAMEEITKLGDFRL